MTQYFAAKHIPILACGIALGVILATTLTTTLLVPHSHAASVAETGMALWGWA